MLTNDNEKMQMESVIDDQQPKTTMVEMEETEETAPESIEKVDEPKVESQKEEAEDKLNKPTNGLEVAIMLPPPPVLMPFIASSTVNSSADARPASSASGTGEKDEEEVLSLQVLSARSSTPYTVQGICCANANCAALEATTDAESNASHWKEEQTTQVTNGDKKLVEHASDEGHLLEEERKKYSRSDLLDIRREMTTIRPECLEEARLQRLHFRKGDTIPRNTKSYRNNSNPPNDLMPAFFKRKTATNNNNNSNPNSMVYDSFKYNDSNPFNHEHNNSNNNHRRIGSGRISSSRQETINWDYIPEEDPDRHQLPEFFTTKDSSSNKNMRKQQPKHELDDNANYVKRAVNSMMPGSVNGGGESSFRSMGSRHSINSSKEERYNSTASSSTTANNKSDEPEWFSCGPTSRLDIIELCGFNESDQQKIRQEMSKNKADSNNNRHDFGHSGTTTATHKEKKHLAFQFDEFSSGKGGGGASSGAGPKMPASKFMPLFNAKKRDDQEAASQTQSLNDLFMFGSKSFHQKEKLNTNEMPSVDEIEAKWRGSGGQSSSEAFNNSSENFKKMLNQLNQQQQQQGPSMPSPPPVQRNNNQQQQQQPMNLFNNENLSNFIKHRNLQQQLLQKQQQQAAFAQLQFNAILSRPDTQMLLLSLARGEISKHGLVVQLANPNLTQADREAISAALTFSTVGQFHQQMAINQSNQQQFIANQLQNLSLMQQQLNKSPVGGRRNAANYTGSPRGGTSGYQQQANNGNGGSPRTYTQEELQSHANFILHNAMLKKKLEEQNLGLQKMLHLQSTLAMNGTQNNMNAMNGVDSMAGTKNFNHPHHQQQQQQQRQHQNMQQQQQRHRKTPTNAAGNTNLNGNRSSNHPIGRRRSTSSSSSNTVNSGNMTMNSMQYNHLQLRRQLEQRRNTIATATVGGGDDFVQIPQRI